MVLDTIEEDPMYSFMLLGGLAVAGGVLGHLIGGVNLCTLVSDLASGQPTAEQKAQIEECKERASSRAMMTAAAGGLGGLAVGAAALAWQSK